VGANIATIGLLGGSDFSPPLRRTLMRLPVKEFDWV